MKELKKVVENSAQPRVEFERLLQDLHPDDIAQWEKDIQRGVFKDENGVWQSVYSTPHDKRELFSISPHIYRPYSHMLVGNCWISADTCQHAGRVGRR